MLPPDPRDEEFSKATAATVVELFRAIHRGDCDRVIAELNLLLTGMIEHNKTLTDRPSDEPLRRALARLSA